MPRGIQENDVWQAADALLQEGARPTIERVRQKIGRGSPNTVSPFLDTWFKHLGGRIKDPGAFAAPADVPEPVLQAAKHFWEASLAETRRDFDERLRDGMAAAVANVEAEKERAATAEAAAFEASSRTTHLQVELAERNALLEQERMARAASEAHLEDARRQVAELQARLLKAEQSLTEVRAASQREVEAAQERSAGAERRAALEIEAERLERSRADKRAQALERKLDAALSEAQTAHARHVETTVKLHAEAERLKQVAAAAAEKREEARSRAQALALQLTAEQRASDHAKGEAAAARALLLQLKIAPPAAARKRFNKSAI